MGKLHCPSSSNKTINSKNIYGERRIKIEQKNLLLRFSTSCWFAASICYTLCLVSICMLVNMYDEGLTAGEAFFHHAWRRNDEDEVPQLLLFYIHTHTHLPVEAILTIFLLFTSFYQLGLKGHFTGRVTFFFCSTMNFGKCGLCCCRQGSFERLSVQIACEHFHSHFAANKIGHSAGFSFQLAWTPTTNRTW